MIDVIALLLCNDSPALRREVLRHLAVDPDPAELEEIREHARDDRLVTELRATQRSDGSWGEPPTAWALLRLGALGYSRDDEAVARAAEHLFSCQQTDGSWPMPADTVDDGNGRHGYDTVPLQTSLPLIGLAACGYATDVRAERAYEWLVDRRLDDGCWPTGRAGGVFGYVAGYRRLPHSRWGCRSNTTAAALALALHPTLRTGEIARRAVDHLLSRETRDRALLGFETARLFGFEPARGFFTRFARFDPGLVLELAVRTGAGTDDPRVARLARWIEEQRGANGLWRYEPNPVADHWVSYRLSLALGALGAGDDEWQTVEPPTPFTAYPRKRHRF